MVEPDPWDGHQYLRVVEEEVVHFEGRLLGVIRAKLYQEFHQLVVLLPRIKYLVMEEGPAPAYWKV